MEALLRREQAAGEAAAAAQGGAAPPPSSGGGQKKKAAKPVPAAALSREIADEYFIGDDPDGSPDEADSDLEENGYAVPEVFKEPQSTAEAEGAVGHRVFLASTGASGSIIGWNSKQKLFEVELDRDDERITVRARDLMSLQVAPPSSKKKKSPAGKAKQKPSSSEGRGESSSAGIKKKKKKGKPGSS